jgi:hypothetical protein
LQIPNEFFLQVIARARFYHRYPDHARTALIQQQFSLWK